MKEVLSFVLCTYNFKTIAVPVFVTTTYLLEDDAFRYIMLPNQNTYSPYCSELLTRDVLVSCRAIGDPEPTIDIYREHDDGNQQRFYELYRNNGELVVSHSPIRYGENIVFHCNATNIASFVNITINLTYTCKWFVVTYYNIRTHMH